MKTISSKSIIDYFVQNDISFKIHGVLSNEYKIASIFEPVKGGFFFLIGNIVPNTITNSLLLVNRLPDNLLTKNNCFLEVTIDPQIIFYKFLSNNYSSSSNGIIQQDSFIDSRASIGKNVQIDHFCVIGNCVINDNVKIGSHSRIHDNVVIGRNTVILDYADIGTRGLAWIWDEREEKKIIQPQLGGVIIGKNCIFASNTIIVRGSLNENTKIGRNTLFAPGCRLGHGTIIGDYVHFANNVVTGGNTKIKDNCFIGSSAVFRPKVKIDRNTIVGSGAVVVKNTTSENLTLMGNPAKEFLSKINPNGMPKPKIK